MIAQFKIRVVTPSIVKKMNIIEELDTERHVLIKELADKFLLKRSEVTVILDNNGVYPFAKMKGKGAGRPRKVYHRHAAEESITDHLKKKYEEATGSEDDANSIEVPN